MLGSSPDFRRRFQFSAGLRFELFYGLQTLTDSTSRIHKHWREKALKTISKEFWKEFQSIGGSHLIWPVMADVLRTKPIDVSFEAIIHEMGELDISRFQKEILCGALHYEELAEKLLAKEITLPDALAKIPKPKQEWLSFIGLYPYQKDEPMVAAMELLIHSPEKFRKAAIRTCEIFWRDLFKDTWRKLQPQLERSRQEKERLFESCSFDEFSRLALLRIEVDEKNEIIRAARGGYALPYKNLKEAYFIPSLFNDKRYWTAFEEDGKTTVYFPYFDPAITLDLELAGKRADLTRPEPDPALIFKALGDTTRFALVKVIAKNPKSSVELAKILSVSKPTISHHVHVLRDAGLIQETYLNGSVLLSLNRGVLEAISEITVNKLFGADASDLKQKRSKS